MGILLIVLIVLTIIDCILIVISILLQEDKSGGGIGMLGGSSQSFFGASSGNMLAKITTILLVIFIILSIVIAFVSSRTGSTITDEDLARTRSTENMIGVRKTLTKAPAIISNEVYEKEIIAKLTNDADKKLINNNYKLDSSKKFLSLKKNVSSDDEKKITKILNSINFSTESISTVISPEDLTSDASSDN